MMASYVYFCQHQVFNLLYRKYAIFKIKTPNLSTIYFLFESTYACALVTVSPAPVDVLWSLSGIFSLVGIAKASIIITS